MENQGIYLSPVQFNIIIFAITAAYIILIAMGIWLFIVIQKQKIEKPRRVNWANYLPAQFPSKEQRSE